MMTLAKNDDSVEHDMVTERYTEANNIIWNDYIILTIN